jgi:hypothetical protein
MPKLRSQGKPLEEKTPSKVSNFGLSNGFLHCGKVSAPSVVRRLQVPSLVENINHGEMRSQPLVGQPRLVTSN